MHKIPFDEVRAKYLINFIDLISKSDTIKNVIAFYLVLASSSRASFLFRAGKCQPTGRRIAKCPPKKCSITVQSSEALGA